ncbi:hypothetical protein B0E53_03978 [Micromonospora sp. MH33]|uniref:hypothetical protein n=1 Tax=Micromonospora sp. MH33 TaxID=1945509 RepID=UPI000D148385|nr:hypothetical protein [Micromonospora sp. MH33]PSK64073.1 hypothetical protein B0E53_03978 [Micromonospora sp. MH33]
MAEDRAQHASVEENERRSDLPRGGVHPERPTGGPAGRVPEADRATWETGTRKPSPVPDEPLPPQD